MSGHEGGTEEDQRAESEWQIPQEAELRFQAKEEETPPAITLKSGTAEVFGAELPKNRRVEIPHKRAAVFTYHGCTLSLEGTTERAYVNDETPMLSYLNAHAVLQRRREGGNAPKAMIAAPRDAGKTTVATILANYASRAGNPPLRVDLDPEQNLLSAPGSVSAAMAKPPLGPGEEDAIQDTPLAYGFQHSSPEESPEHWESVVQKLGESIDGRTSAGCIIDTPAVAEGVCSAEGIARAANALKVDVVLVLGEDALKNDLERMLTGATSKIEVVSLAKSGGVVNRGKQERKKEQAQRFRRYFYGERNDLRPDARLISFADVTLVRVGGHAKAPKSALPVGMEAKADPLRVSAVEPGMECLHHVLAVPHAQRKEDALSSPLAGFVHVRDVDPSSQFLSLLCPGPDPLPSPFLLLGSIRWLDEGENG